MSAEFISLHVQTRDASVVRQQITALFAAHGFALTGDAPAADAVDSDPEGYGVLVSASTRGGWVSVYVADWQDSGALARALSQTAPTLEMWTADETLWGYTLFADGAVADRFASHPSRMADTQQEQELYKGDPQKLNTVLHIALPVNILQQARQNANAFAGASVDALCEALGLPFAHAFTGFDEFFDDDPEDYAPSLDNWGAWCFLSFTHPAGRDTLED